MKKFVVTVLVSGALLLGASAHAWVFNQPNYGNVGQPTITTRPNIFGGVDIQQGFGQPTIQTRPNIFGGYDINQGFGRPTISCHPNIFGGVDCR
jgi:hypothetical protein